MEKNMDELSSSHLADNPSRNFTTSDSIVNIAKAYVAASPSLMNHDKKEPGHNYKYTTIERLLDLYKPILAKHGLAILALPFSKQGHVGVTSMLLHASGEFIACSCAVPLPKGSSNRGGELEKATGGIITYLRRYLFESSLAVAGDKKLDPDDVTELAAAASELSNKAQPPHEKEAGDMDALLNKCTTDIGKLSTMPQAKTRFEQYRKTVSGSVSAADLDVQWSTICATYGFELEAAEPFGPEG